MSQDPPLPLFKLAGVKVWDASSWFPTLDTTGAQVAFYARDKSQVTGIAIHHDAVAFAGGDQNFDGQTWDEERDRMQASYDWHTRGYPHGMPATGWNWPGMGYHVYCFPSGRIYEVGRLSTVRAHVAHRNTPLVGIVGAGDFTNRKPDLSLQLAYALAVVYVWEWSGRNLAMKGHRTWAAPGWESNCPGETHNSWVPDVYTAARKLVAEPQRPIDPSTVIRAALQSAWRRGDWQELYNQLRYIGFR